jgi:hypothetical protein
MEEGSLDIGLQTPVGTVAGDGCCAHCHYSLYSQKVLRDERLSVLVCRCPECGRFTAADALESRPSRAAKLLYGNFVAAQGLVTFGMVAMLVYLLFGMQDVYLEFSSRSVRVTPAGPQYAQTLVHAQTLVPKVTILAFSILLALLLALTLVGYGWRWRSLRRLIVGLVLIPGASLLAFSLRRQVGRSVPTAVEPLEEALFCIGAIQLAGFILGEVFHRSIYRLLLRIFLPMALRRYLTHFWTRFEYFAHGATAGGSPAIKGGNT